MRDLISSVSKLLQEAAQTCVMPVFGEEAVSADPSVLNRLSSDGDVWLIDPLDGTSNFAQGTPPFALMIALIRKGSTIASWIFDPVADQLSISEKGSGSWVNGEKITISEGSPELNDMRGAVLRRFLPMGSRAKESCS